MKILAAYNFSQIKFLISSVSNNKRTQNERAHTIKDNTLNKSHEKNESHFIRNSMKRPSKRPIAKKAGDRKKLRDQKKIII